MVGNPPISEVFGKKTNLAFMWNLARFSHYHRLIHSHNLELSEANAIEVGPGYGLGAYLWILSGEINSYTVVDLKENLINSYFFLSQNFPSWSLNLVSKDNPISLSQKTINFMTPENFEVIEDCSFDLALNTDSFGEMPKKVAQTYLDGLINAMKPGAVLISMNGHRRGEFELNGVHRVSEYGYHRLKMIDFSYKPFASSAYDDFGHCAILQKIPNHQKIDWQIDTLADLFAVGINLDLDPLLTRFNAGDLNDEDERFLSAADRLFEGNQKPEDGAILEYVYFMRQKLAGEHVDLGKAVEILGQLQSPQARYYLRLITYMSGAFDDIATPDESPAMKFLSTDLMAGASSNPAKKLLHKIVRREQLRKKFFPRVAYKPATVLVLKQKFRQMKNRLKR
jgi:hypothetical protein